MSERTMVAVFAATLCLSVAGCASLRAKPKAAEGAPEAAAAEASVSAGEVSPPDAPVPGKWASLRELCRVEKLDAQGKPATIDEARRRVQETVCGANLWFDGLFGGPRDVENARAVSGAIEGSEIYSQAEGNDLKVRMRLRYDVPNLKHRLNLFLGRGDQRELIEDRVEGLAVRSAIFGLDTKDDWLAGFGYRPPGKWAERIDFRVGARLKTNTEVYAQGRYFRNRFVGEKSVFRFRETIFWENREDGFGSTTSLDFDHLMRPKLLFRWANVATVSQSTEGAKWRTSGLLYQSLNRNRALLYQLFVRGESAADVPLREFGGQAVLRMPIGRRWLFGNFTVGYSWPRFELVDRREGSALVGFGIELQFGENPY